MSGVRKPYGVDCLKKGIEILVVHKKIKNKHATSLQILPELALRL